MMPNKTIKIVSAVKKAQDSLKPAINAAEAGNFVESKSWLNDAKGWIEVAIKCAEEEG